MGLWDRRLDEEQPKCVANTHRNEAMLLPVVADDRSSSGCSHVEEIDSQLEALAIKIATIAVSNSRVS